MKNLIGIFLLICLVVPIAGSFTWLHFHKKNLRKEVKQELIAGMDKSELTVLKFYKEEVNTLVKWEHAKEFEYQGQMYDVIETQINGNIITYWCWWDHKETHLNKQLNELLTQIMGNNQQKKEKQQKLLHFYQSLFVQKPLTFHFKNYTSESPLYCLFLCHKSSYTFSPLSPPPRRS